MRRLAALTVRYAARGDHRRSQSVERNRCKITTPGETRWHLERRRLVETGPGSSTADEQEHRRRPRTRRHAAKTELGVLRPSSSRPCLFDEQIKWFRATFGRFRRGVERRLTHPARRARGQRVRPEANAYMRLAPGRRLDVRLAANIRTRLCEIYLNTAPNPCRYTTNVVVPQAPADRHGSHNPSRTVLADDRCPSTPT